MDERTIAQLEKLVAGHREIEAQLSDPATVSDREKYRGLHRRYNKHKPLAGLYENYRKHLADIEAVRAMLDDADAGIQSAAREELEALNDKLKACEGEITAILLAEDEDESDHVFLEVRAGTGGDEAAIFAGDLFRMYMRYAEMRGWEVEVVNSNEGEHGGFREVIARIGGGDAYARLKFESGVHRVQRVPVTESQGRLHTSAATVAVLPEAGESDDIEIKSEELRVDTFRASGAGGQHVNKTDSAIRLTHLPTGLSVECQNERSQHRNRMRAMNLLKAKLLDMQRAEQRADRAEERRNMVGGGDRSERIRTYNFPQNRITDHRIQLTLYQLEKCLEGELDALIDKLIGAARAARLARDIV